MRDGTVSTGRPPPCGRVPRLIRLSVLAVLSVLSGLAGCTARGRRAPPAPVEPARQAAGGDDEGLPARLHAALAAKGSAYIPRTRHKNLDGTPRYTNRLIFETSPYLLQHAHNPVDWRPWGPQAFEAARQRGVPVFLSVGYSTCHWCHVMEEESFEDEEIASFLNRHYVCIKVDREVRPDIDGIYMSAVQALTGTGGWPMSVWLTPDREPFFGGTYFPPRDGARGARRGFLTLLRELAETYERAPVRVKEEATVLANAVRRELEGQGAAAVSSSSPAAAILDASVIAATVNGLSGAFDEGNGGLRRAPKFPSNLPIRLLLRHHRRTGDTGALRMATLTLEKMAAGGIYDQLGGGFHRYSTDAAWLVPHFEKMLYDNALLAVAYLEAYQVTARADFARVARETLDYVLREMTGPTGGFFSATDADSEGAEGKFFVWSEDEIRAILGAGSATERFVRYYGVTTAGNFEGRNILHAPRPDETDVAALASARARLYAARAHRVPPSRDEKILVAWNGLMISALAAGSAVLGEPRYLKAATDAADFVLTHMRPGGQLQRAFKDGRATQPGYLDDYAFLAAGLLDLYEASFEPRWLREGLALVADTERLFADPTQGAWFMTSERHERLIARERPRDDGALPSGASVALMNALRAATFTDDDHWRAVADRAFGALWPELSRNPFAMTDALLALDYRTDNVRQVVIVRPRDPSHTATAAAAAPALLSVVRRVFLPNRALAGGTEGEDLATLAATAPFVGEKRALAGRVTAYVCTRGRCDLPTNDPDVVARQLARAQPEGH